MIIIETTPNLYGIKLEGDYLDLNALYDSISRYLEFYQHNNEYYPYHEYEFMLSLNYDIRHAYMGTRGVEVKENNAEEVGVMAEAIFKIPEENKREFAGVRKDFKSGNLYFSVEILYPLVFHYLVSLEDIAYGEPDPEWFDNLPDWRGGYDRITANGDRNRILAFTSLLWQNLSSLFGKEKAEAALDYYENGEFFLAPSIYTSAVLHWQLAHFHELSEEGKKAFLLASLYEIMDTEVLTSDPREFDESFRHYDEAMEAIKEPGIYAFPEKADFYERLDEFMSDGKKLYHEVFDGFLEENYGVVEDEDPEM